MRGTLVAAALLMGVSLSGCGGTQEAPASESTTAAAVETPSPTPSTATEAQVASVIAGYQKDWRKVIHKAADCRWKLTMKDPGVLAHTERMTCYAREVTAGTTAKTAMRDLDALSVPDSQKPLVKQTEAALQAIADVHLESVCGPAFSDEIRNSHKCDRALGTRMWAYQRLDTALDRWSPYL